MPRKILFKQGAKSKAAPNGYKSLIVDDNEQITLVGTSSQLTSFAKDAKPTTLISDAEFYTWGTYSIYPSNYWTTFKQSDNSFHLVDMKTVLPTHDFFDDNLESELVFGIFKENGSQLNFCGAFDPMELVDPLDYIEGYRRVTAIFINNVGTSYEAGTNISTAGGSGTGLTVDIELGGFTNITINNPGTGYKVNDVVIVSGGDLNAEILITSVTHVTYPNSIFTIDFIKTDGGLKMINMALDSESLTSYYYTNKYFDIDISLSNDGEILGSTLSSYRDLNSPDSSSLEELNSGWSIDEFNYLDNYCQKNFANPKIWYYIRINDINDQIDFCKYDLSTNTIEIILEDLRTWWDVNADVPWEIEGSELNIKGGIIPHPDKPLLLGNHSGDILSDSYLIGPDTYHRFGDNKTTDYQTRLYTKNKMWIINPLVP
jgi:hypothetical protein